MILHLDWGYKNGSRTCVSMNIAAKVIPWKPKGNKTRCPKQGLGVINTIGRCDKCICYNMVTSDSETIGVILDVSWNTSVTMGQRTMIYHVGSDKDPLVIGTVLMSG